MQLDLLLVNYNDANLIYQDLSKVYSAIEPPTWSLLLAGACRAKNYSVRILDADAERLSYEEAVQRIKDENPRLVCFVAYGQNPNSSTTNMEGNLKLARELKESHSYKVGFLGTHTSALPHEVLSYDFVDFVFINEGVKPLIQLLSTDLETDLHKVKGIGFKKDGVGILNSAQDTLVKNGEMDEWMPEYAVDLLPYKEKPLDLYRSHFWHTNYQHEKRTPFFSLYTSLGCIFSCSFCPINIINRTDTSDNVTSANSNIMRFWSTEWVLNEIDKLVKLGVETTRIADEMFFLNRRYYEPLLEGIIERGYNLNMWTYARVDTIREKYLELFKKAGINYLGIGIEAANQKVRQEIDKGKFKDVDIREIRKRVRDSGINGGLNYIFGLPTENLETMQETLDLAIELQGEFSNFYCCTLLPGSPLYYEAKQKGWELPQTYSGYGFLSYDHVPSQTEYLTAAEVLKFRDDAWQKYYTNDSYLNMMESKFGQTTRKNIEEQTKVKLKRKLLE